MDLIQLKKVTKTYKTGVTALYDLDLNIEKGDFVFIIGSTGCGKSTIIKMIYREERPTTGQIIIGGKDISKVWNSQVYKIRRKMGVVFQDYKLLEKSTVYENVAFALEVFGLPKEEIHEKVIMCIIPTREYFRLKEGIKKIDENALVLVTDAYEVLGGK